MLIGYALIGFLSSCDSKSNIYQPSKVIVNALENDGNALSKCNNYNDSIFVYLYRSNQAIKLNDTILASKYLAGLKMENVKKVNLLAKFDYLNGILEDDSKKRISLLKKSSKVFKKIQDSEFAESLYQLANSFYEDYQIDSSIYYSECVLMEIDSFDIESILKNKQLLKKSYASKLMFSKAVDLSEEIVNVQVDSPEVDSLYLSNEFHDLANLYYDLHELEIASQNYDKALAWLPKAYLGSSNMVNIISNHCLILVNSEEFERANEMLAKLKSISDSKYIAFQHNRLTGLSFYRQAIDDEAVVWFEKARQLSNDLDLKIDEWLDIRIVMMQSLFYLNDLRKIESIISEVENIEGVKEINEIMDQPNWIEFELIKYKQKAYKAIENKNGTYLKNVLESINKFILHVDYFQSQSNEEDANNLAQLCLEVYGVKYLVINELRKLYPDDAYHHIFLQAIEKEKANSLFSKKVKTKIQFGDSLNILSKQLVASFLDPNRNVESIEYLNGIEKISPLYANLYFGDSELFVNEAKKYCSKTKTNIVEYIYTYEGAWAILITDEDVKVYELGALDEFTEDYSAITNLKKDSIFFHANKNLYESLFAIFEDDLTEKNITLISENIIDDISFDAFISDKTGDYLVKDYYFNKAYSIKTLLIDYKNSFVLDANSKVIAYSFSDSNTMKSKNQSDKKELVGSYQECSLIKKLLGDKLDFISGFNSTKEHFLNNIENYDVVHLALHGSGDENSIKKNHIYFRGNDENANVLNSQEIEEMNLDLPLFVLNACETNVAREIVNQGNFSMARSFASAGVGNIITSSWLIPDESSSEIIVEFYNNLQNGLAITDALTMSKRKYLESNMDIQLKHPYYWSSLKHYKN